MASLDKATIIRSVAEELGLQKTQSAELVETFIELIKGTLAS